MAESGGLILLQGCIPTDLDSYTCLAQYNRQGDDKLKQSCSTKIYTAILDAHSGHTVHCGRKKEKKNCRCLQSAKSVASDVPWKGQQNQWICPGGVEGWYNMRFFNCLVEFSVSTRLVCRRRGGVRGSNCVHEN